jgi:DNA-binding FrmR family transcriptional regulator
MTIKKKSKTPKSEHCAGHAKGADHPDHSAELNRLRRIKGQLNGIESMITDRRYCPDILIQVRAAASAMKSLDHSIFERHLRGCVREAVSAKDPAQVEDKIQELLEIMASRN